MNPLTVVISETAYERMQSHCRSRTDVEVCGILVGRASESADAWTCEITDVIEGEHASEQGVSVTFTSETWTHVHSVMETLENDVKIVGWFHTHPGFGIFYSSQDEFIQREFFDEGWMPGIVVDPVADHLGVFQCVGGKIQRLDGLSIDEESGRRFIRSTYREIMAQAQPPLPPAARLAGTGQRDNLLERMFILLAGVLLLQILTILLLLTQHDVIKRILPTRSPTQGQAAAPATSERQDTSGDRDMEPARTHHRAKRSSAEQAAPAVEAPILEMDAAGPEPRHE